MIAIDNEKCSCCCGCVDHCPVAALNVVDDEVTVDTDICMECLICTKVCPLGAPHWVEQT